MDLSRRDAFGDKRLAERFDHGRRAAHINIPACEIAGSGNELIRAQSSITGGVGYMRLEALVCFGSLDLIHEQGFFGDGRRVKEINFAVM